MAAVDPIYHAWISLNPQHPWPEKRLGAPPMNTAATMSVDSPARKAARAKWLGVGKGDKTRPQRTPEERAYMREYQRRRRAVGQITSA
jgi:hypothetical protein